MKFQIKLPKEPMQTRDIPLSPWQIIASDVLENKNQDYLVVIDYYSKYIEALKLSSKKSYDVIRSPNGWRRGYAQTLIADNVPYNSREMR